ncbi:MAG: GAF and ANTAR domain-containing protein [Mycobacteriales bacterium]
MTREDEIVAAFVSMAGHLASGGDVVDMLSTLTTECAWLLEVTAVGLLLADRRGALHVLAASSERAADLEAFQVQRGQGPCHDCYSDGRPVVVPDVADQAARWPAFVPVALGQGVRSVHAVPLRLRDQVLGALGLFGSEPGELKDGDVRLAQALADVATIALIQDRVAADRQAVNEQLQTALDSRVGLEQAKGVLSQAAGGLDMTDAFAALRRYARDHNVRIADVARAVVQRSLPATVVLEHARAGDHRPGRP